MAATNFHVGAAGGYSSLRRRETEFFKLGNLGFRDAGLGHPQVHRARVDTAHYLGIELPEEIQSRSSFFFFQIFVAEVVIVDIIVVWWGWEK